MTGVYNVYADTFNSTDRTQQWHYNVKEQSIYSNLWLTEMLLSEGATNNLFMYFNKGIKNQKFSVDLDSHRVFNKFTEHTITLDLKDYTETGNNRTMWNLVLNKDTNSTQQQWEVVVCDSEKLEPVADGNGNLLNKAPLVDN